MNPYRQRVWQQLARMFEGIGRQDRVLDFGSGDGWFASQVVQQGWAQHLVALDVKRRERVLVEPLIYTPGAPIPFDDRSFDLVYSIDVLHHCADPFTQLQDIDRVARRFILLKDHTYETQLGRGILAVLDEVGNRRFGIPSLYQYQHRWAWRDHLQALGWRERALIHPSQCHVGVLGRLTNSLQYVALYERSVG